MPVHVRQFESHMARHSWTKAGTPPTAPEDQPVQQPGAVFCSADTDFAAHHIYTANQQAEVRFAELNVAVAQHVFYGAEKAPPASWASQPPAVTQNAFRLAPYS